MSEEYLIRNCAPTLAGIKTGSLFTCPYSSKAEVISSLRGLNQKLLSKGLRVLPLRFSENRALIYLYRPKRLEWDLHQAESVRILQSLGYRCAGSKQCLGPPLPQTAGAGGFSSRNRAVPGLSPRGCMRFHGGQRLQMHRLLESLYR